MIELKPCPFCGIEDTYVTDRDGAVIKIIEPKPCPFCGGEDIYVTDRYGAIWIDCNQCGATISKKTEKGAMKAWNRRTSDEED